MLHLRYQAAVVYLIHEKLAQQILLSSKESFLASSNRLTQSEAR